MELFSKATSYTYLESSLFSLVASVRSNFVAMGNPSNELDT